MSTTERDALVLALDRALQAGLIGHDAENFLLTEIDAALAAPSGGMPTPPPVAQEAVDEAIALLVEQMDMLRADAQKWHDGDPKVPFAVIRDALIAALNAYDDAVPALRALLTRPIAQGEAVAWVPWHPDHGFEFDELESDEAEFIAKGSMDPGWIKHALYTHPSPEREGWKLVPVEPTEAMLAAPFNMDGWNLPPMEALFKAGLPACVFDAAYRSMLAAAPTTGSSGE